MAELGLDEERPERWHWQSWHTALLFFFAPLLAGGSVIAICVALYLATHRAPAVPAPSHVRGYCITTPVPREQPVTWCRAPGFPDYEYFRT